MGTNVPLNTEHILIVRKVRQKHTQMIEILKILSVRENQPKFSCIVADQKTICTNRKSPK
jgi:hypothetical protein